MVSFSAGWNNTGCYAALSNESTTICTCDHLTNFAILMSPWAEVSHYTQHTDTIMVITILKSIYNQFKMDSIQVKYVVCVNTSRI